MAQQQQSPASAAAAAERAALSPTQVHGHPMAAWHHGGHGGGAPTRGYLDNGTREKRKARGSFTNYVYRFMPLFDPPPTLVDSFT